MCGCGSGILSMHCSMVVGLLVANLVMYTEQNPTYSTRYDNIDLNEVVSNPRLLKSYVDCLMDKGRCSPDGLELKENMPDAIETDCSRCSEKQKTGSDFIMGYLIENEPEYWAALEEKYDPSGSYKNRYLEVKASEAVSVEPLLKPE